MRKEKLVDNSVTILVLILNLLVIYQLRQTIRDDSSDKTIILFWFFYPLIVLANSILWLIVRRRRLILGRNVKWIIITLVIIFFPVLFTIYE